jgi:hypothetical protein
MTELFPTPVSPKSTTLTVRGCVEGEGSPGDDECPAQNTREFYSMTVVRSNITSSMFVFMFGAPSCKQVYGGGTGEGFERMGLLHGKLRPVPLGRHGSRLTERQGVRKYRLDLERKGPS